MVRCFDPFQANVRVVFDVPDTIAADASALMTQVYLLEAEDTEPAKAPLL
jgi:hypothetical protein